MENGFDYEDKNEEQEEKAPEGENEYIYKTVMDGKHNSRIWSVASLVLSIVSLICCCFGWASLIMAILSIVFAIISRKNIGYFDGVGLAGLIVGIFGIVFSATYLIGSYVLVNSEYYQEFLTELENAMQGLEEGEL